MSTPIPEETPITVPVREIISLILLLLGIILISLGSFLLWGLAGGLFATGIIIVFVAVVMGYRK